MLLEAENLGFSSAFPSGQSFLFLSLLPSMAGQEMLWFTLGGYEQVIIKEAFLSTLVTRAATPPATLNYRKRKSV